MGHIPESATWIGILGTELNFDDIDGYGGHVDGRGDDGYITEEELIAYLESRGLSPEPAAYLASHLINGYAGEDGLLTFEEFKHGIEAWSSNSMTAVNPSQEQREERFSSLMKALSETDSVDITGLQAHTAALMVFLQSSELLDEVVVSTLKSLQKKNDEIKELNAYKNHFADIKSQWGESGSQPAGNDALAVLLAIEASGSTPQWAKDKGYTVEETTDPDTGERSDIVTDASGTIIYDSSRPEDFPNFKLPEVGKDQLEAADKALDSKISELTSSVELLMTTIKNLLTKREAYGGSAGGIISGWKGMTQSLQ